MGLLLFTFVFFCTYVHCQHFCGTPEGKCFCWPDSHSLLCSGFHVRHLPEFSQSTRNNTLYITVEDTMLSEMRLERREWVSLEFLRAVGNQRMDCQYIQAISSAWSSALTIETDCELMVNTMGLNVSQVSTTSIPSTTATRRNIYTSYVISMFTTILPQEVTKCTNGDCRSKHVSTTVKDGRGFEAQAHTSNTFESILWPSVIGSSVLFLFIGMLGVRCYYTRSHNRNTSLESLGYEESVEGENIEMQNVENITHCLETHV